jgi:hypothetical protein
MRINTSTIVVFFICIVLGAAYFFFGKGEINKRNDSVNAEIAQLTYDLEQIRLKEIALPELLSQLPAWRRQAQLYRKAIPLAIEDDEFLASIADQLPQHDTRLLGVDVVLGGPWLGRLGEEQIKNLEDEGIDAQMAQKVKVAFYSIRLLGQFDGVINTFENLKGYERLYSVDEVAGPASAGAGAVSASTDPDIIPIRLSGRIYYGLPEEDIDFPRVIRVFGRAKLRPVAESIKASARQLVQPESEETDTPEESGDVDVEGSIAAAPRSAMEVPVA